MTSDFPQQPVRRQWLPESWAIKLAVIDPGGMKVARAVHMLLTIAIAAAVARQLQPHVTASARASFDIVAPFVAAHAILFTAPGTRRAEAVSILRNTAIALAVFGAAAAIGWGNLAFGHAGSQFAWVAAIALGFYLRRYGPAGFRTGMALSLYFMIVVVFDPTRTDAAWWLLAAAIGGLTSAAIALLIWRPSATHIFQRQQEGFLEAVLHALKGRQAPRGAIAISSLSRRTRQRWEAMAQISSLAAGIRPQDHRRIENIVTAALRMDFALRVIEEDDNGALRKAIPGSELSRALARTIDLLASGTRDAAVVQASIGSLRAARDAIVARQDEDSRERFHQARMTTALVSLVLGYEGMRCAGQNENADLASRSPEPVDASDGAAEGSRSLGLRLALQGLVATSITTVLGRIFALDHAYWATLTVIVVIGASVGATVRRTIERALGTAIGVFLAIGLLWLSSESRAIQIALVIVAFIPIFILIERYFFLASCLIGFLVVAGLHLIFGITSEQMFSRAYETAIGASIGLAVAALLVPIRATGRFRQLLRHLLDDCRGLIVAASESRHGGTTRAPTLQGHVRDLSAELDSIQSERLLTRGGGFDARRLRAHCDVLTVFVPMLADVLYHLSRAAIPDANRALLAELTTEIEAYLMAPLDRPPEAFDIDALARRWTGATPLDGTIRAREAVLLIEALYYGRRCCEALDGLRHTLTRHAAGAARRGA